MLPQQPEIAELGNRRLAVVRRWQRILLVFREGQRDIDFAHFEAADAKIDFLVDFQHLGEFILQGVPVPTGLFAQAIERQPQQPQFRLVEIADDHGRSVGKTHLSSRQHETPAGDDAIFSVDDEGKDEAELRQAFSQFLNLLGRVLTREPTERLKSIDANEFGIEIAGYGKTVPPQRGLSVHS